MTLQDNGLIERYYQRLAPESQNDMRSLVAGSWVPVDLAMAHYRACEALCLSRTEQLALGKGVGQRQDKTLFRSMLNLAKGAGVTPWTPLGLLGKIKERVILGGGLAVYKLSPKDAVVEAHLMPFLEFPYVQTGYYGMLQNTCEYFCRRAYMKVHETNPSKTSFLLSWA
jgi:hypothetical protein